MSTYVQALVGGAACSHRLPGLFPTPSGRAALAGRPTKSRCLCTQRRLAYVASGAAVGALAAYRHDPKELQFELASALGPALRALTDAETAHAIGIWAARTGFFPRETRPDPPSLRTSVWGREFPNPIGARRCCTAAAPHPAAAACDAQSVPADGGRSVCTGGVCGAVRCCWPSARLRKPALPPSLTQVWLLALTRTRRRWSRCWHWALGLWK